MNCRKYQLTRFLNHSIPISVITIIPNEGNVWLMLSWQCHSKKITERSKVEQSSVDGIELKCNDSEIIFTLNSIQVIGGKQNASTVITLGGSIKNKNKLIENYPACFNGTSTSKSYLLQRWIKRFSAALRTKFLCCHFRGINGIGIYFGDSSQLYLSIVIVLPKEKLLLQFFSDFFSLLIPNKSHNVTLQCKYFDHWCNNELKRFFFLFNFRHQRQL